MWEADCSWHRLGSCHQNIHKAFRMETNIIGHKQQHRRWIFQFEWSNSPPCFSSTWRLGKRRRSKMTFKQVAFENGQSRTNLTTCTAKFRTSKDQNLLRPFALWLKQCYLTNTVNLCKQWQCQHGDQPRRHLIKQHLLCLYGNPTPYKLDATDLAISPLTSFPKTITSHDNSWS